MKILYLDESGDHSLSVIDPQYPVFVLGGVIVAERRDRALDSGLLDAWRHLRERGTAHLRPQAIRDHVAHLRLEGKQAGIAGLEIADLVVSRIGRFVAGKPPRDDWTIVESKLRRRKDDYPGAGLVILPKE